MIPPSLAGTLALAFLILFPLQSQARHHHHIRHLIHHPERTSPKSNCQGTTYDNDGRSHCHGGFPSFSPNPLEGRGGAGPKGYVRERRSRNNEPSTSPRGEIITHPAGCPHIAFCGCGAAVEVFGRPVRSLWLAAAWFRYPRAAPGAGMAAVRQHHVMIIREYLGDGRALVYDANSGHHLTRVHVVSLRGYTIVNPRSG